MITATEAAKKSDRLKTENINPQEQLEKISKLIDAAINKGNNGIYLDEELLEENMNELQKLGYSYSSGYGIDCKSWHIHW